MEECRRHNKRDYLSFKCSDFHTQLIKGYLSSTVSLVLTVIVEPCRKTTSEIDLRQ